METKFVLIDADYLAKQQDALIAEFRKVLDAQVKTQEQEEIMQIQDVCKYLKKSRQTIENWSKAGFLKKRMIGDSVFYLRSEVIAALKD